ncbi:MAG: LD-carboxypeptidase [Burkholderiaceae bacterium]
MAHIYVYSPSSAVRDRAAFRRGLRRLAALGHDVEVDTDALTQHMRFAGDDATRVAAIHRAADSGADIAIITRGGYGLTGILGGLDYRKIARSIDRGMLWVGLSDFTALQSAVVARSGRITWAGPALGEDLGTPDEPDDIMLACFDDLVQGQGEGAGWSLPRHQSAADLPGAKGGRLHLRDAVLWGGNLTVLTSLLGTPWWPAVDRGVLFLEDVGEHPYRVERMLTQLLHAGVLARQKAIVLGQFTGWRPVPGYDRGFGLRSVAQRLQAQLAKARVPVLMGLPFGHVPTKVMLPIGAKVDLLAEGRDALLVWGHT